MNRKLATLGLAVLAGWACSNGRERGLIAASGTIEAVEVRVAAKVPGQVLELAVEEGARVEAGAVLATIDHASLDIQLRQAQAGVALAEAQLALLVEGARAEDIQQARAALSQAEAGLKVATDDAVRMRELARTGSVTPKQRDDAEARLTVAEAQRSAAAEAVRKLERLARPAEVRAAEARVAQAGAAADLLAKTIADATVVAPAGGVVTHKAVEAGETVTPGATLFTVADLARVHVMIYVNEVDLDRVRLGDPVEVRIDAFPERAFEGRVTYISPEAEFTPKNVQTKDDRVKLVFGVKVEIPNPDGALKPGLPADAVLRAVPAGR
jgi:HlyD family secretion protein